MNHELDSHPVARGLAWLYPRVGAVRRWRIARALMHLILRLERGAFRSATARALMRRHHGVDVGAHSYGELFDPALVPPGVTIGRYASIAPGVRFLTQNHPTDRMSTHPFFYDARLGLVDEDQIPPGALEVGNDVWIGRNAIVTPGCRRIGHGAIVGAGAIVTRDVPDFAIVAGNPARLLKHRFDEATRARVLGSAWWERSVDELGASLDEMLVPVTAPPPAARPAPTEVTA